MNLGNLIQRPGRRERGRGRGKKEGWREKGGEKGAGNMYMIGLQIVVYMPTIDLCQGGVVLWQEELVEAESLVF